jgi:hypothetical protein
MRKEKKITSPQKRNTMRKEKKILACVQSERRLTT